MGSLEGARSEGSHRGNSSHGGSICQSGGSQLRSSRSGSSRYDSSSHGVLSTSHPSIGAKTAPTDIDEDNSDVFALGLGGANVAQKVQVLRRRRENKRVYAILQVREPEEEHTEAQHAFI